MRQNFFYCDARSRVPSQIHAYLSGNLKELRNLPKDDFALRPKVRGRWYRPDARKARDLHELRTRGLLRDFDEYRHSTQRRLKLFRLEAIRAGSGELGRLGTTPRSSRSPARLRRTCFRRIRNY